jgi:hypothetical protein
MLSILLFMAKNCTYRVLLAREIFLPSQHVSVDVRNHRFGIRNRYLGIRDHHFSVRNRRSGTRNHHLGIYNPYVGVDRQLGLKGSR